MKLKNKVVTSASEVVVLPREDGDIIFKIRGVLNPDYEEFEKLCPVPTAPMVTPVGKPSFQDVTDKSYREEMNKYAKKKFQFMMLKSFQQTEDFSWETVVMNDSETWANYDKEIKDVTTPAEYNKIIQTIHEVNGLSDRKIEEAKQRFMLSQAKEQSPQ